MLKNILKDISRVFIMFLSLVSIRSKTKWVFGSNMGYVGNTKYFFEFILANHKEINAIWIADSKDLVDMLRAKGYNSAYRMSPEGLYHSLTAKVFLYNSYASEINIYASIGRAIRVNLWHGVGIKNIEHKISSGPLAKIFSSKSFFNKFRNIDHFLKPDLFLSTSPLMDKHFSECFRIGERSLIKSGYPRCDILLRSENELSDYIVKESNEEQLVFFEKLDTFQYVYMYMPTWRDGKNDFLKDAEFNLYLLNEQMIQDNSLFIFKLHPSTNVNVDLASFSNITLLDNRIDVYPLLPFIDVLITDYSSIYYDFILLKDKFTILYPYDLEEYLSSSRDLAFPYDEYTKGELVLNFSTLLSVIKDKSFTANSEASSLKELFWSYVNENNSEKIYREILNRI